MSIDQFGNLSAIWEVPPLEGVVDNGALALDLTDVLVAVGEAAQERKRGIVLLVDEVQFLSQTGAGLSGLGNRRVFANQGGRRSRRAGRGRAPDR